MDVRQRRDQEVSKTVGKIRDIEKAGGVNRDTLADIKGCLIELATQDGLFPLADFPLDPETDGNGVIYRLSEDPDHRFALYASVGMPGKGVRPHNHTTWAVIVGIAGDELNRFYERTDDGSVPGQGTLRQFGEEAVKYGTGVAFLPDDIHSIHVEGDEKTVHLHMYGLALEQLHQRVMYDQEMGTYKVFPASQNIKAL
jgi:predicted metal-dependent enzyme (double-stranded beta helix superfamily)